MKSKYSFDDLIDKRNQVNWELLDKIQFDFFSKNAKYNLKNRPEKHSGENTTWEHIQNVVKSAKKISLPKGVSRRNLILAALFHDIGKPYRNEDHGLDSAKVMDKLFERNKDYLLIRLVVRYHMFLREMSKKDYKKIIRDVKKKNIDPKRFIELILTLNKVDILRNRKKIDIDEISGEPLGSFVSKEYKVRKALFEEVIMELD